MEQSPIGHVSGILKSVDVQKQKLIGFLFVQPLTLQGFPPQYAQARLFQLLILIKDYQNTIFPFELPNFHSNLASFNFIFPPNFKS